MELSWAPTLDPRGHQGRKRLGRKGLLRLQSEVSAVVHNHYRRGGELTLLNKWWATGRQWKQHAKFLVGGIVLIISLWMVHEPVRNAENVVFSDELKNWGAFMVELNTINPNVNSFVHSRRSQPKIATSKTRAVWSEIPTKRGLRFSFTVSLKPRMETRSPLQPHLLSFPLFSENILFIMKFDQWFSESFFVGVSGPPPGARILFEFPAAGGVLIRQEVALGAGIFPRQKMSLLGVTLADLDFRQKCWTSLLRDAPGFLQIKIIIPIFFHNNVKRCSLHLLIWCKNDSGLALLSIGCLRHPIPQTCRQAFPFRAVQLSLHGT